MSFVFGRRPYAIPFSSRACLMFIQQLYAVRCCEKYIVCFDVNLGIPSSFVLGISSASCFAIGVIPISKYCFLNDGPLESTSSLHKSSVGSIPFSTQISRNSFSIPLFPRTKLLMYDSLMRPFTSLFLLSLPKIFLLCASVKFLSTICFIKE